MGTKIEVGSTGEETQSESTPTVMGDPLKDYQELKTCHVKVTINLDTASNDLPPTILKALDEVKAGETGTKTFQKEIVSFVPRSFRTWQDEIDNSEKLATLLHELEEWSLVYFGHLLSPRYIKTTVQHAISLMFWLCPFYPVDSFPFKIFCNFVIPVALADDWLDQSNTKTGLDNEGVLIRMEAFKIFNNMLGGDGEGSGFQDLDSNSDTMKLIGKNPLLFALYDAFTGVVDMVKEEQTGQPNFKPATNSFGPFQQAIVGIMQVMQWRYDKSGKDLAENYSIETCRFFRQDEGIMYGYIAVLELFEDLTLSQNITNHRVFKRWRDLAGKIDSIQNDVLGFQKDLREGEVDGIVMRKIRRGHSLSGALSEEFDLLSELSMDYLNLRGTLLTTFPNEKLRRFIEVVDSCLYGNFYAYIASEKYGMRGQIEISQN